MEYHETVPPVWLSVDIGIKFPDGRKAFVEVKERKEQWEALIAEVKSIGQKGVDLNSPDRGDDPLRKAKYIVAGRPYFFAGYFGDGFDVYKVTYKGINQFKLDPAKLPRAQTFAGNFSLNCHSGKSSDQEVGLINRLLDFLQEGFQDPLRIFQYLKSREKCSTCSLTKSCDNLISDFSGPNPWDSLDKFFRWSWRWYTKSKFEEPVNIVFILPRIAQFLETELGWHELKIR